MNRDDKQLKALNRRTALSIIGGAIGAAAIVGCGGGSNDITSTSSSSGGSSTGSSGSCTEIPDETAGPYPADGTTTDDNGVKPNLLSDSRIFRSDIRSNLDGTSTQDGIPLTLTITLEDTGNSCGLLDNAAVYIWHCNRTGNYSAYTASTNGNYEGTSFLRGAQISGSTSGNASGVVTFTTIYPGRYDPRATHIHIEIYSDSSFGTLLKTSQFAFPDEINTAVYNTSNYTSNQSHGVDDAADMVFGTSAGGDSDQLLTVTGDTSNGYAASITVGVAS